MKIGILTFHSQLNYGGVLQCWALKEVLKGMGHDVVVIDRWLDEQNTHLNGPIGNANWKGWVGLLTRSLLGCGQWAQVIRHWRTRRFVKSLGLTPYHFYEWKDAPKDLGVDCIVVGSDQVWHGGDWALPTPEPYLLKGAPSVRAIAYAASLGMKKLPTDYDYAAGFRRFAAISVRESEAVPLVKGTGYPREVAHMVDPTLLLPRDGWQAMGTWKKVPRRVVCYFLSQKVKAAVELLEPWARQNHCEVKLFCAGQLKEFPKSPGAVLHRMGMMLRWIFNLSPVHVCTSSGPREFVRAFAQAELCITDSFHAVMFSSIYDCNVRFLRPQTESRKQMFARIEEFAATTIMGNPFVDDVSSALKSFDRSEIVSFRQDVIARRRMTSRAWLEQAVGG